MTAFAAVLSLDGSRLADRDARAIDDVLASATGNAVTRFDAGPCTLLAAPLHPWDAPGVCVTRDGLAAAGAITLEGKRDLAQALGLDRAASPSNVVAAAVEQWDAPAVSRLHGEYAFATWNERARQLVCARDPFGLRLLYVGSHARVIVVSNVIDAVLAHAMMSRELDQRALVRFLRDGSFTNGTSTPYSSVRMIPAGHTLAVRDSRMSLERHWRPPHVARMTAPVRDEEICEGFRRVLDEALHDRVNGHPWTLLLSGGLDSTALASLGKERGAEMRAVTFTYPLPSVADEPRLAAAVASRLGIPLEVVDALHFAPLEAERAGAAPGVPVNESLLANWREGLSRAEAHSTLVVHGDDGDALLAPAGGAALFAIQSLPSIVSQSIRYVAEKRRLPYLGIRLRERLGIGRRPPPGDPAWLSPDATRLLDDDSLTVFGKPATPLETDRASTNTWHRLLKNVPCDFALFVDPGVTRRRVELTFPMMDQRVISYVNALPSIPWRQKKHLLRVAFDGRLPREVLQRAKTPVTGGDEACVTAWRRCHLEPALRHIPVAAIGRFIDLPSWQRALRDGAQQDAQAAWRVLMLDRWLRAQGAC